MRRLLEQEIVRVNCEVYIMLQSYLSATISNDYSWALRILPGITKASIWKAETVLLLDNFP